MGIFRSIVETLVGSVLYIRHNLPLGGAIRAQLVGDDPLGRHAGAVTLIFHQRLCGNCVG